MDATTPADALALWIASAGSEGPGGYEGVADPRPELSASDLALWEELIREQCGLHFPDTRKRSLGRGLWQRMSLQGLTRYQDYYNRVAPLPAHDPERRALAEALANGETSFFRHKPSFKVLSSRVLPALAEERRRSGGPKSITLWSAGCSSGEETYSMAMAALTCPELHDFSVTVLGTDLNRRALYKARQGHYPARALAGVPDAYRRRFFVRSSSSSEEGVYSVNDELRSSVRFEVLWLNAPASGLLPWQDVIFCQNVVIYFRDDTRGDVVERLGHSLAPDGCLFLGPGEMVGVDVPGLRAEWADGCVIHRRSRPVAPEQP